MQPDDVRFLFAYDRWATRRILDQLPGLDPEVWGRRNVIDERGLGGILVHQLGAAQRWRNWLQNTGRVPKPERRPLPTVEGLRARWEKEWAEVDAWLPTFTDAFLAEVREGLPVWQVLAHVLTHGTQHRSEAAALLTAEDRSPGDLDLLFFAEELAEAPG